MRGATAGAEEAGWLLEPPPDDVWTLGWEGPLPTRVADDRTTFSARPCIERWVATCLGRVRFPDDEEVMAAPPRVSVAPIS